MSLNPLKAPNNTPIKILKLLLNDFSSQLTELLNLYLTHAWCVSINIKNYYSDAC